LAGVACAYDWLYDTLTPEQRTLVPQQTRQPAAVMHAAASVRLKKSSWWQETFFPEPQLGQQCRARPGGVGAGRGVRGGGGLGRAVGVERQGGPRGVVRRHRWFPITKDINTGRTVLSYLLLTLDQMKAPGHVGPDSPTRRAECGGGVAAARHDAAPWVTTSASGTAFVRRSTWRPRC